MIAPTLLGGAAMSVCHFASGPACFDGQNCSWPPVWSRGEGLNWYLEVHVGASLCGLLVVMFAEAVWTFLAGLRLV